MGLQPSGEIHGITEYLRVLLKYTANMDADAEYNRNRIGRTCIVELGAYIVLNGTRPFDSGVDALEYGEYPVAHHVHDASLTPFRFRFDGTMQEIHPSRVGAILVGGHQRRVTNYIGERDCH